LEWNEVALHLLLNARDAIHESGRKGHIRVRVAGEAEHAVLEIEDNGDGIPAGELPRVFDPGFTTKGAGVGTGLGLAICFRIVRSRGGTIDVDSRQGAGTVFTIRVPFGGK
jgi:signal transduction histidine kinase